MSDAQEAAPRPVSTIAVVAILAVLSLFWLVAHRSGLGHRSAAAQNLDPDNLSKDLAWKATPESRRQYLDKLRMSQAAQASSYGWVDQKAGIVQLPIDRAMELVAQEHGIGK
jgi:hypothetical protein